MNWVMAPESMNSFGNRNMKVFYIQAPSILFKPSRNAQGVGLYSAMATIIIIFYAQKKCRERFDA